MYPLLYKANASILKPDDFTILGRFTSVVSAIVTEERNGDYTLEMEITHNDYCADKIDVQQLISAKPNFKDEPQLFEVYSIDNNFAGNIKISAKHIKHNLFNNYVEIDSIGEEDSNKHSPTEWAIFYCWGHDYDAKYDGDDPLSPYIGTGQMTAWPHYFTFRSDYTVADALPMPLIGQEPFTVGDFFGGKEGSLLDVFGGEYYFDNFHLKLFKSRGEITSYRLRYGSNISSLSQSISTESMYTHCVAYAKVKNTDTTSGGGSQYMYMYSKAYGLKAPNTLNRMYLFDVSDDEPNLECNIRNSAEKKKVTTILNNYAKKYADNHENGYVTNATIDYPAELEQMQSLNLCDTVWIDTPNASWQAKIIKTEYDVIREKWKSLELGTPKLKLSDFFVKK